MEWRWNLNFDTYVDIHSVLILVLMEWRWNNPIY